MGADPCQVSMWIYRGKGPPSVPTEWFEQRVRAFRVSAVQEWLGRSTRSHEPEWVIWRKSLAEHFIGDSALELDERATAERSAEVVTMLGANVICTSGSGWKPGSFPRYVRSLLAQEDYCRGRAGDRL
jgi:hypothetical protein